MGCAPLKSTLLLLTNYIANLREPFMFKAYATDHGTLTQRCNHANPESSICKFTAQIHVTL